MPGGRSLYFEYADSGASPYLAKVKDAVSSGREVGYVVTGGYLVEVESAGGKTTEYDYAQAQLADSDIDVLTKVTDPRGLETSFLSCAAWVETPMGYAGTSIYTYLIAQPTGLKKRISLFSMTGSDTDLGDDYSAPDELPVITSALVGVTVDGNGSFPPSSTSGYDALTSYGWDLTPSAGLIDLLDVPNGDDDFYDPQAFVYMGAVRLDPGGLSNHNPPRTQKVYSSETQNLIYDGSFGGSEDSESYGGGTLLSRRGTGKLSWYNFRGQPLRELVYEGLLADSTVHVRDMVTDYAYWGKDKYFQQKAVRGPYDFGTTSPSNIRYSWTDYYDSSAADGKKGQTKRVYRSGIDSNVSN